MSTSSGDSHDLESPGDLLTVQKTLKNEKTDDNLYHCFLRLFQYSVSLQLS